MDEARIPVIPLSYSDQHLRVEKELMIDYETGKIYVVSANDKTIIFDITQVVLQEFNEGTVSGDSILIYIEGVGEVDLGTIINEINSTAIRISKMGTATPVQGVHKYDLNSIVVKNNLVQITGFDTALDNQVPKKVGGVLTWVNQSSGGSSGGGGGTMFTEIEEAVPDINGFIYIGYTLPQITNNLSAINYTIILPSGIEYKFCRIYWRIVVGGSIPTLIFPDNLTWQYSNDNIITQDSIYSFEFETWDNGLTWYGKNVKYGSTLSDESVTADYVESNVYSKVETNNLISWKTNQD